MKITHAAVKMVKDMMGWWGGGACAVETGAHRNANDCCYRGDVSGWRVTLAAAVSNSSAVSSIMSLRHGSFDWAAQFRQYLAMSKSTSERSSSRGSSLLFIGQSP